MNGISRRKFLGSTAAAASLGVMPTTARASCGARRMAECAALLIDDVLPHQPIRLWVLSVPYPLRFLFASRPAVTSKVLGIVYRAIATHLTRKAGYSKSTAYTGAVTVLSS